MKKFLEKLFYNPFYVYALVWAFSLLFYTLHWSDTYPKLSFEVVGFICITIILSLFIGSKEKMPKLDIKIPHGLLWRISIIMLSITSVLFFITFLFKGVPIVEIFFSDRKFNYSEYKGILIVTITAFALNTISITLFFIGYKILRIKKYLILLLVAVFPLILMFNRLYAMISLLPLIFTWGMLSRDKIYKYIIMASSVVVLAVFVFGIVGNFREEAKNRGREEGVTFFDDNLGEEYPSFLSKEFFWAYFYFTSPIAKFQYVTDDPHYKEKENDYVGLVLLEVLPNAAGYRLNDVVKREVRVSDYGYPVYYAGTAYRKVFLYAKWGGVMLYTIWFFGLVALVYHYIGKLNILVQPVLLGTLCTVMALSVFSNMLMLTIFYLIFGLGILISLVLNKLEKNSELVKR